MLRMIVALGLSLLLAGCWTSEKRFFNSGDWARLDLSGEYDVARITTSDGAHRARFATRPDGLIEITPLDAEDGDDEPTLLGLVPITGGSGSLFLAMDRTPGTGNDVYYLASLSDDGDLGFYYPVCEHTPRIEGLVVTGDSTCTFTTEDALMQAALEAERFLAAPHIVAVAPFLSFSKSDVGED